MTQAFINHIILLDNTGTLTFFTDRLNDFKVLSDVEFKDLFGIPQELEINKNEIVDNMLNETKNIVNRKDALDELFLKMKLEDSLELY